MLFKKKTLEKISEGIRMINSHSCFQRAQALKEEGNYKHICDGFCCFPQYFNPSLLEDQILAPIVMCR